MDTIRFSMTTTPDLARLQALLNGDPHYPHIHLVDMPYRLTSTWQDQRGRLALWERGDDLLAWALFQPPWWNVDYALHPSARGSDLEKELFAWGTEQIKGYARQTGELFYGSVEFFEDAPGAAQTADRLRALGFEPFEWSTLRFQLEFAPELPQPELPEGFTIRSLEGPAEVEAYVELHRAAFGSEKMTVAWRQRTLAHPAYRPELDLVVVEPQSKLVGFCIGWLWRHIGQIEPMGVHPDYQDQGLGRGLELAALHALRRAGARIANIDHVSLNEKAIALSLQNGFVETNRALRYFIDASAREKH